MSRGRDPDRSPARIPRRELRLLLAPALALLGLCWLLTVEPRRGWISPTNPTPAALSPAPSSPLAAADSGSRSLPAPPVEPAARVEELKRLVAHEDVAGLLALLRTPPDVDEAAQLRAMSITALATFLDRAQVREALQAYARDPKNTAQERALARSVLESARTGTGS